MYNVQRIFSALLAGAILAGMVLVLGGIQNGLLWNHLTPESFNEWGTLLMAGIAGSYGVYLGFTGKAWRSY